LQYEDVYCDRLAQIPIKAQSSGQVIGAESITRFPTSKPVRTRGLSEQARVEPHINIQIRFDFDSARLRAGANELLDEIGQALKHEALNDRHSSSKDIRTALVRRPTIGNCRLSDQRPFVLSLWGGVLKGIVCLRSASPRRCSLRTMRRRTVRRVTFVNMGKC
jgi:hypothetical protein